MSMIVEKRADKVMMPVHGDHEGGLVAGVSVVDVDAPVDEHADDLVVTTFSSSHQGSPAVL